MSHTEIPYDKRQHGARLAGLLLILAVVPSHLFGQPPQTDKLPYHLVANFTSPIEGKGPIVWSRSAKETKVGLVAGRLAYEIHPQQRRADFVFPDSRYRIPAPGVAKLWVKGDGSGNRMSLVARQAEIYYDNQGRRRYRNHKNISLPVADTENPGQPLLLDFKDWREVTLDASGVSGAKNVEAWWHRLQVVPGSGDSPQLRGELLLDDFRVYPSRGQPSATFAAGLLGSTTRDFTTGISLFLDVRSFSDSPANVSVRVRMTDRNDNLVVDRDFPFKLEAGTKIEVKLELKTETLSAFLPPLKISGDVLSGELPEVSKKFEYTIVMGNVRLMFDDMSDVFGRWRTAWYDVKRNYGGWAHSWTHGEGQRCTPFADTAVNISRVTLTGPAAGNEPPSRFAMQVDYRGETAVYTGHDRYFPGNAYRAGFWIKGNGRKDKVRAMFLDYSNLGSFWNRGWARLFNGSEFASGERDICTLDFEGWRYFEVPLPGDGLGANTPGGSTNGIDFPIELTCLHVIPDGEPAAAAPQSFQVGPIYAVTQAAAADSLAVHVGYDDANHVYAAKHGAWVTVQNGWRAGSRRVRAVWTLSDADDKPIASGRHDVTLAVERSESFRIDLAPHADKIASRRGPLRLEVVASDLQDLAASAKRQIVLSKPDSLVLLVDFESDRGYIGLRAEGVDPPPSGEPAARTSTDQHHSGQRSLAIEWDKQGLQKRFVSIDPPVPGVPSELSVWVYGDASGVLFYPLIGDQRGVSHGLKHRTWDFFFPRKVAGTLPAASARDNQGNGNAPATFESQSAVRIDFRGWRKLTFHLPPISPDWNQAKVIPWRPDYPLGVHLAVDASQAGTDRGVLHVDDVSLRSHIAPQQRVAIELLRESETNVYAANQPIRFRLNNYDAADRRTCRVVGAISDWRGRTIGSVDRVVSLAPGKTQTETLAETLPPGAYQLRLDLFVGDAARLTSVPSAREPRVATIMDDILVADLKPWLGPDWKNVLKTDWKLRGPIQSRFTYVDHDWDWIEFHPGNFQFDSLRKRADFVRQRDGDPFMLLGFSAYYASGVGREQMTQGAFQRRQRDIGHAINTFLVPERDEDWDNYVHEMMRGAGQDVAGWVVWNNPDGSSSLAVKPDKLARMLATADKWRRRYCPDKPLLIGGMRPATAPNYLRRLEDVERAKAIEKYVASLELTKDERKQPAVVERIETLKQRRYPLDYLTGINLRMDVGRLSPEDAQVVETIEAFQRQLNPKGDQAETAKKQLLLSDLDWAVEQGSAGLDAFDQAAYLVRSDLLLSGFGIRPVLDVRNQDHERSGLGLVYRRRLSVPPMSEMLPTYQIKPGWWGVARIRRLLDRVDPIGEIEVQDVFPGKTKCLLLRRKSDGKHLAIVWRNDDAGYVSFARTGVKVESAEDVFGGAVQAEDERFTIGKIPVIFTLNGLPELLALLRVDDGGEPAWHQRTLAAFTPTTGVAYDYAQSTGEVFDYRGQDITGRLRQGRAVAVKIDGSESFTIDVPKGAGLVLRRRYLLDEHGQSAEVFVHGRSVGTWDLKRREKQLGGGIREAVFVIDRVKLGDKPQANIEIRYKTPGNTIAWRAFEYRGGEFPLTTVGPLHADQRVRTPRLARNMIGAKLRIGKQSFDNGIGSFAPSLLEYPLCGQFSRLTVTVGVDAATNGRGSVIFEIYGDEKKLWSSPTMSGLDPPRDVDIDVAGVNRLRLIVTDANDGNRFDAANWCNPTLLRDERP